MTDLFSDLFTNVQSPQSGISKARRRRHPIMNCGARYAPVITQGGLRTKDRRLKQTMLDRATIDAFGHLIKKGKTLQSSLFEFRLTGSWAGYELCSFIITTGSYPWLHSAAPLELLKSWIFFCTTTFHFLVFCGRFLFRTFPTFWFPITSKAVSHLSTFHDNEDTEKM